MPNMELITSVTVGSGGAASVTLPASGIIPQTYTDLKVVVSARNSNTSTGIEIIFNGTSSGYTMKRLYGTGSGTPASDSGGSSAFISNTMVNDSSYTASTFGNGEIYIPNYSVAGVAKSVSIDGVTENNATTALSMFTAGLSSATGAITTIGLVASTGNFVEGSTFYLYGISNVTSSPKAIGGIVSQDATYWYHTFPFSSTFTPTTALSNVDYLVIAGGGGGGGMASGFDEGSGGGGAGGLRSTVTATGGGGIVESKISLNSGTAYAITVGAGGAGQNTNVAGSSGGNSSIAGTGLTTITSTGGGGGGANGVAALTGGSGGGGGGYNASNQGSGTANQGYAGGNTVGSGRGGGGGGAGAAGSTALSSGNGGNGVVITAFANATFTGTDNGYYAGGGGGGGRRPAENTPGTGGLGGGGTGGIGNSTATAATGVSGTANTGGGGGGGGSPTTAANIFSGNGGSGLVILRYAK